MNSDKRKYIKSISVCKLKIPYVFSEHTISLSYANYSFCINWFVKIIS